MINLFNLDNLGIKNLTCNGKCIACGECCGSILPIDQDDLEKIAIYVVENNIKIQKNVLVMQQRYACPYFTGIKGKGCAIYEVRPKICRDFVCNKKPIDYKDAIQMRECVPVNMWNIAEDLEKMRLKSEKRRIRISNKKN